MRRQLRRYGLSCIAPPTWRPPHPGGDRGRPRRSAGAGGGSSRRAGPRRATVSPPRRRPTRCVASSPGPPDARGSRTPPRPDHALLLLLAQPRLARRVDQVLQLLDRVNTAVLARRLQPEQAHHTVCYPARFSHEIVPTSCCSSARSTSWSSFLSTSLA